MPTLAANAALFAFLDPVGPALDFYTNPFQLLARPPWPPTAVLLHLSVSGVASVARRSPGRAAAACGAAGR